MKFLLIILSAVCLSTFLAFPETPEFDSDTYKMDGGDLKITFIGHASLMMEFTGKVIHIDPFSRVADYSSFPQADMIIITHHHSDHLDPELIKKLRKEGAPVIAPGLCCEKIENCTLMKNGDEKSFGWISMAAVPAYNMVHKRPDGNAYHVKGEGNGYVLTIGGKRIYIAGDTENIPEMKALKNIDVAFLPMNLPYTMTEEMVADAVKAFRPGIIYPYHYRGSDTGKLVDLLKDEDDVKVLIRDLYKGMKQE
jgi:L-ascorbate metabolism protein UlaG (beta-lactamase superfamily)